MVVKWCHCYVNVTSLCNVASKHIQELVGIYFKTRGSMSLYQALDLLASWFQRFLKLLFFMSMEANDPPRH